MPRQTALYLLLAGAALAAGCASPRHAAPALAQAQVPAQAPAPPQPCPAGQSRETTAELVFGRNVGNRLMVTDADWRRFVDEVVTPRFPDGLSVIDVQGQWRQGGVVVHEPSKIVYLVLDGGPDDPAKIRNIRQAYKDRFHQDSVLLVSRPACVSF